MNNTDNKSFSEGLVLEAIMNNTTDSIFVKDIEGRYIYANQHMANENNVVGPEKIIGKTNYDFFPKDFADKITKQEKQIIETGVSVDGSVITYMRLDGHKEWRSTSKSPVYDHDNHIVGILGISRDVTEVEKAKEETQLNEKKFRQMIENISDIIIALDEKGVITYTSPNIYNIFAFNPDDITGKSIFDFVYHEDIEAAKANLNKVLKSHYSIEISEFRIIDGKDKVKHINWCAKNLISDSPINGILVNFRDVSMRVKQDSKIRYLSYHDILTDLYNRSFFEEEKRRLDIERQLPISIVMGDVNGLKLANDTFGHIEGDRLLKTIADILKKNCRNEDIVARIGGDEFCILLPKTTLEMAEIICSRINHACANYNNSEQKLRLEPSISLGAATKKEKSQSLESIFKSAEENMYKNKKLVHNKTSRSTMDSFKKNLKDSESDSEEQAEPFTSLALKLGKKLSLRDEQLLELDLLSRIHDIGKIGIEDEILYKTDKLTEEEWKKVKKHPEIGFRIAQASDELIRISDLILCHHERWDGKGYPKGIKGNEIPLLSRIISVIDAYNAMTQDRPYRKAMTKKAAVREIIENAGKQFDPEIVEMFVKNVLDGE